MQGQGAVIILAAGASKRMGAPKALLPWGEKTFVGHLCGQLDRLDISHRAVVTRAELAGQMGVDWPLWINPEPDRGMLSSLQTALSRLPADCPWLMVTLVDQPAILLKTFQTMLASASPNGWSSPVHQGRRGHPVVIGRQCFSALRSAAPEGNPRDVLGQFPRRLVEVDDAAVALDFDTPEEWASFRAQAGFLVHPPRPEP
ncbi:MAG: nucleotidyltransferase family protein [Vulcanimicrobiota bacterium]